ncbi:MAG: 2'-5' RNA ligase family protein, partial [Dermatophilaceae bacterium]
MPLAALEAVLDRESDDAVRACWAALDEAGLPSQAQHRGETNAPHVTLVSAPVLGSAHLAVATTLLTPSLPVGLAVAGWVVFGEGSGYTLALLGAAPAALVSAVEVLGQAVGDPRAGGWVPHVTVARRIGAGQLERAMAVVD